MTREHARWLGLAGVVIGMSVDNVAGSFIASVGLAFLLMAPTFKREKP
jgi:hypothetical protein